MSIPQEQYEFYPAEDERYRLGNIIGARVLDPTQFDLDPTLEPKAIYEVDIADPYVEQYSTKDLMEVKTTELSMSELARTRREAGAWERRHGTAYFDENNQKQTKKGWGDPVTRSQFFDKVLQSPALDAWRAKIPSAEALADLSDPIDREVVRSVRHGSTVEVPVDETAHKWLTLCTDAIAIRSRGTTMANVVKEFIDQQRSVNGEEHLQSLKWMSIACGTALPAMKAAIHAGIRPDMLLVDLDESALQATRDLASEIGFEGSMSQRSDVNIFLPDEMARLREELGDNGDRPMLIDLMGIFEYTGKNIHVDPVQFLRSAYDMLHPGGRLVFGQMRDDRPVADFTMGVVSWPYVEMRSLKEFMSIIHEAGIPVESTSLYLPSDNVYTVGVIDKPLDQ